MSRNFSRALLMTFLFAFISSSVTLLQAQPAKPATPDQWPREVANQTARIEALAETHEAELPAAAILTEGFEGVWPAGAWTVGDYSSGDGGEYLWNDRSCWPHTGNWAAYSVGGGASGNNLECWEGYPDLVNTWAIYGPFNLSGASSASMTFHFTGATEGGDGCPFDKFFAGHSANGTDFIGTFYCGDWTGGPAGNQYYLRTIDIAPRLGDGSVWIGFALQADDSQTDIGIMLDDVRIDVTGGCATPAAPGLNAPPSGSSTADTTPTFSWGSVSDATQYQIQVDNNSDFSSPTINQNPSGTSFTPSSGLATGTYYWRVRGQNTVSGCNQPGAWSAAWSFTISSGPVCYALAVDHTGSGSDPVASPTASAGCALGRYTAGQTINLTASPASGWRINSWQGTNNNGSTSSSNTATMPGSSHTVRVNYVRISGGQSAFLPSIHYGLTGFLGPFEVEPNNSTGQANGPILFNRDYQGFPNDLSDYYSFTLTSAGQLQIVLTGITGRDPQLHLYYNSSGNRVGYDPEAPYVINHSGQPGQYWVRVVVVEDYNQTTPYTLRVNKP